jgi:hypothetical protein
MRIALASLLATAAVVTAAQAQTPVAPAPPAPAAAAPAAAAPTTTAPATTAPTTTAPTTTAPAPAAAPAPGSTPAAAPDATAPAPAAEAPPTIPTTGDGAVILNLVEKICVPLVRGGNLADLVKQNPTLGLKLNRRDGTYVMPLGGDKNFNITLSPPGVNKDVCRGEVHYAIGGEQPIVAALVVWTFLHKPELLLQANYVAVDADGVKRVRKSWENLDATSSTAVNFSTWTKPDDSPLNAKFATGEIYYQERKGSGL